MHPNERRDESISSSEISPRSLSRAELDAAGFARRGPDETPLDAWWRLLNGASPYDTPESAAARAAIEEDNKHRKPRDRQALNFGIAEGSEAWNDAQIVGITLHRTSLAPEPLQRDLFFAPVRDVNRYAIPEEELIEPKSFGGDPPDKDDIADEYGYEENGLAIAWDEERVLVCCPRGACIVPRDRWAEGYRSCPGC